MTPLVRAAVWAFVLIAVCALAIPLPAEQSPGPAAPISIDGVPSHIVAPSVRPGGTSPLLDLLVQARVDAYEAPATPGITRIAHQASGTRSAITLPAAVSGSSSDLAIVLSALDAGTPGTLLPAGSSTLAATGTVSRRLIVGPVGGLDEKVISAQRAGARVLLVPETSQPSYIPPGLTVIPVFTVWDAVDALCLLGATDELCEESSEKVP